MKVMNRSTGIVGYSLPELNMKRKFTVGEIKEIKESEIRSLNNSPGGPEILQHYLQVQNENFIRKEIWSQVPDEYFWTFEDIKICVFEDSIELFTETLDYAPKGVLDIIKDLAWRTPLSDLNKCRILKEKIGFDCIKAHDVMNRIPPITVPSGPPIGERLRQGRPKKGA